MYIKDNVWKGLKNLEDEYTTLRNSNSLEVHDVNAYKVGYQSVLLARVNWLKVQEDEIPTEDEQFECAFLFSMLNNGWTVADMTYMAHLYEMIDKLEDPREKEVGENLIQELMDNKIETIEQRFDLLSKCAGFNVACSSPAKNELAELGNSVLNTNLNFAEYADDKAFVNHFDKTGRFDPNRLIVKGRPIAEYEKLYKSSMRRSKLREDEKQKVRFRDDYIISEKTEEELEQFNLMEGHKKHKLSKSTRNAIKEVCGDEIYDDIDEMSKGTEQERTVRIHHSLGNKYLRSGEEVLEMDFAGSGFKEARKEYRGQHGKMFSDGTRNTNDSIESEFGPLVKRKDGTTYTYLRCKKSKVKTDNKELSKLRYTIAGPSPDNKGIYNFGEYSIESTRAYGKGFAKDFLQNTFDSWKKNNETPHPVHINITGHSRGAVAAGESVRLINKWMDDQKKKIPGSEKNLDQVKFGLLLRDPVPGFITNWRLGKQDFRKMPNVNATVFCSVAQEHKDLFFPLQNVRGAKRVIIGATGHDMDLGNIDFSQQRYSDDGITHKEGFYDAETGEMFRGSGVADMPDGVYIADDKFNMIRITSYSQVGKLIDAIYSGKKKQAGRVDTIHDMARNWFVDNNLKMSFADEDDYEAAVGKAAEIENKILGAKSSRLKPIKKALSDLEVVRRRGLSPEEIVKREQALIEAGKKYMAKTRIPNSGDSQYRMDLVSDLVSFAMREKNYITRKHNLDKGNDIEGRELDEKIRAHKARLANKPGALERRIEKEEKRLERDKSAIEMIKQTAKKCRDAEKVLNETRKNSTPSDSYKAFISAIREGAKLDGNVTINQYKQFLIKLHKASEMYSDWHQSPSSNDGITRTNYANGFIDLTEEALEKFDNVTKFDADKNIKMNSLIEIRNEKLGDMRQRLPHQPVVENKAEKESKNQKQNQAPRL